MALSLSGINIAKQKAIAEIRRPKIQAGLKALFSYLVQHKGSPDLQFVAFSALSSGSTVIADAACKLYAVFAKSPSASTASYLKATDDETTASATAFELGAKIPAGKEELFVYPDGLSMASGVALRADTTMAGSTGSATDGPSGFVIVGGA